MFNGPRSQQDWLACERDEGIYVTREPSIELAPTNLYPNQYLQDLQPNNSPVNHALGHGVRQIGNHAYLAPADEGGMRMTRQTGAFRPLEYSTWVAAQQLIEGAKPPPLDTDLPEAILSVERDDRMGYPAGPYGVMWAWVSKENNHTRPSPVTEFTLAEGQAVRFVLPGEPPDGARKIALYMSEPSDTANRTNKFHLQGTFNAKDLDGALDGPYRYGGRPPATTNETAIGRPKQPTVGDHREIQKRDANGRLHAGGYKFRFVETSKRGDSLASERTDLITVEPSHEKVRIPKKGEEPAHTEIRELPYKPGRAFFCRDLKPHPEAIGWKLFVELDGVVYQVYHSNWAGGAEHPFPFKHREDDPDVPRELRGKPYEVPVHGWPDRMRRNGLIFAESDYPTEDLSGIEEPTTALEVPTAFINPRPGPGKYVGTYAPVYGEERFGGVPYSAPPGRITVNFGFVPVIHFPNRANILKNAEFSDTGKDGLPLLWDITVPSGYAKPRVSDGVFKWVTGLRTDAGPNPVVNSPDSAVDLSLVYTARGTINVYNRSSGTVTVHLIQVAESGATSGTQVGSATATGEVKFSRTFGPAGSGAQTTWNNDTVAVRLRVRVENDGTAQRNLTFEVYDLAIHPFEGAPPKVGFPWDGAGAPATLTPSPSKPYEPANFVAIALPATQSLAGSTSGLVYRHTFDGSQAPAGFTNVATGTVTSGYGTGGYVDVNGSLWQIQKTVGTGATNYYQRLFPTSLLDGAGASVRVGIQVGQLPTASGTYGNEILSIDDQNGVDRAALMLTRYGELYLYAEHANGTYQYRWLAGGIQNGDYLDVELRTFGGMSPNGTTQVYMGKNGAVRTLLRTDSGWNWTAKQLRGVRFGVLWEGDTRGRWQLSYDFVTITTIGDELSSVLGGTPPPAGVPYAVANRPESAGVTLWPQVAGAASYAHTVTLADHQAAGVPQTDDSLGVASDYSVAALPGATRGLAEVRDSASTNRLAYIELTTAGALIASTRSAAGTVTSRTLATGLAAGSTGRVEVVATGAGSGAGRAEFWLKQGSGQRQLLWVHSNVGWEGLKADRATGDTGGTGTATLSNVVVSDAGEVVRKEVDEYGADIYQVHVFKHPDIDQSNLGLGEVRIGVLPGATYTVAWKIRWSHAGDQPSYPFEYTLHNSRGDVRRLGSIVGRSAHTSSGSLGVEAGATGQSGWVDHWFSFTVPEADEDFPEKDFLELRMGQGSYVQGYYIAQEPLCALGTLSTQPQRDEARGWGRAAEGTILVAVPNGLPEPTAINVGLGREWVVPKADWIAPEGTSVEARYTSSPEHPPVTQWPYTTDRWEVEPAETALIELTLSREAGAPEWLTPTVNTGSVGLEWRHQGLTTISRGDRSPFPGGTFINGFEGAILRSDYNTEPVEGRARRDAVTPPINKVHRPSTIYFFTERAYEEFLETCGYMDFTIESPWVHGGIEYWARPYTVPIPGGMDIQTSLLSDREQGLVRDVVATVEVEQWEVLAERPLQSDISDSVVLP